MGKTRVEVCLISGRGLRGSSTALFWKTQWFAVAWIDPKDKYCTAPAAGNPVWGTKFSGSIDNSPAAALQVEVYSRDPLFLREKLQGTAIVVLREFLAANRTKGNEEIRGSYQLRKKKSDKARGFVDVSIRVLGGEEGGQQQLHYPFSNSSSSSSYPAAAAAAGNHGVVMLVDDDANAIALATDDHHHQIQPHNKYTKEPSPLPLAAHKVDNNPFPYYHSRPQPYSQPTPFPTNFSNNSVGAPTYPHASSSYSTISNYLNLPARSLLPQSLVPRSLLPSGGYNNYYRPNYHLPISEYTGGGRSSYINMPSSSSGGGGGFGMGAGIGAVGAGAFLFGDEFVAGALDVLGG